MTVPVSDWGLWLTGLGPVHRRGAEETEPKICIIVWTNIFNAGSINNIFGALILGRWIYSFGSGTSWALDKVGASAEGRSAGGGPTSAAGR